MENRYGNMEVLAFAYKAEFDLALFQISKATITSNKTLGLKETNVDIATNTRGN